MVSVLVSVEDIVILPPLSEIDTLLPAIKSKDSVLPKVLPPAVTFLNVLVFVSVEDITPSSIVTLEPAENLSLTCDVDNWVFVSVTVSVAVANPVTCP